MNYKERAVSKHFIQLLNHFPVIVVAGARQVGKSTMLTHLLPEWESVVFDPVVDVGTAREDPELFLKNHPPPLVLDEIQYCPELVPTIKRWIDHQGKPGMFVLTGSQQWSVLKSVSESLAGRAAFIDLESFSVAEIAESLPVASWLERYLDEPDKFLSTTPALHKSTRTIHEQLWRGTLPKMDSMPLELGQDYFSAYLRTYIERDARLMLDAADWQQFGSFVQLAAALTAQEVNFSQLGREIGITPQTSKRWLAVLAATFQWFEMPAYQGNAVKRLSAKPKGYLADTGMACYLAHITSPQTIGGHPLAGPLFETFMAGEIRKLLSAMTRKPALFHWRSHGGAKIDLILERDGILYPIEIKLASRPTRHDTRGFAALRNTYPQQNIAPGLVLAPATNLESLNGIDFVVPYNMI